LSMGEDETVPEPAPVEGYADEADAERAEPSVTE
jgi:hypothetical protein